MYKVCWLSFKNGGNERLESTNVLDDSRRKFKLLQVDWGENVH